MRESSPSSKEAWISVFDEKIAIRLKKSACASFENGAELLKDAEILFDNHRYARSGVISILALEEFAKSFILSILIKEKRWDSEVYLGLRKHGKKHAFIMGAIKAAPAINHSQKVTFGSGKLISTGQLEKAIKQYDSNRVIDKVRLRLQFVDIRKDGSCTVPYSEYINTAYCVYLAKRAWYLLCYYINNKINEVAESIENGINLHFPPRNRQCIEGTEHCDATHSMTFNDATTISLSFKLHSFDDRDTYIRPIAKRAEDIVCGFSSKKNNKYPEEVCAFWRINQTKLDICEQLRREMKRLDFRFSPYLVALEEVLSQKS